MTKAELKRKLTPGTKIRCVKNWRGPCDYPRTVVKVRADEVVLRTEGGRDSYLGLGKGITVEEVGDCFVVRNTNVSGEIVYKWEINNALSGANDGQ